MKKLVGDEALAHAAALGAQLYVEHPGRAVRAVSMPEAVAHAKEAPGEVTCEEAPREPAVLRARAVSHCRGLAANLVHLHKLVDDLTGSPGLAAGRLACGPRDAGERGAHRIQQRQAHQHAGATRTQTRMASKNSL